MGPGVVVGRDLAVAVEVEDPRARGRAAARVRAVAPEAQVVDSVRLDVALAREQPEAAHALLLLVLIPLFFADHILKSDVTEPKVRTSKSSVLKEYKKMRVEHETGGETGPVQVKKVVSYQAIN